MPEPDPVPHPDHIELDMRTGQIVVDGPFTQTQRDTGRRLIEQETKHRDKLLKRVLDVSWRAREWAGALRERRAKEDKQQPISRARD
jgi:hypothetical protein